MKSTGIVRKVDPLGRVVIPKEIRRTLGIEESDPMEIYVDQDRIVLRKYEFVHSCVFCGSTEDDTIHKGKHICKHCLESLKNQVA